MEAIKFVIEGRFGKFTKPDTNKALLTYMYPSKPTLLGILGAIIGLNGHSSQKKEIEFYEKLKDIQLAIIPNSKNGVFQRIFKTLTNSTGVSKEGMWLVTEEILIQPSYTIFLNMSKLEIDYAKKLSNYLLKGYSEYPLYLGRNSYFASIKEVEKVELTKSNSLGKIDSIFPVEKKEQEDFDYSHSYKEFLPTAYSSIGYADFKEFCFSDGIQKMEHYIYMNKKLCFF